MKLLSRLFRRAPTPSPPPVVEKKPAPAISTPAPPSIPDSAAALRDEQSLQAAIAAHDADTIARLVTEGSSARVRQQAAEHIHDPARIKQLIKRVRGKDKNAYKVLKQKNDALLAAERGAAQIQVDIDTLCAALERHSHLPYDALFAPTLEQMEARWEPLAPQAAAQIRRRVEGALDRCHQTATRHVQKLASEAARAAALASAAQAAAERPSAEAHAAPAIPTAAEIVPPTETARDPAPDDAAEALKAWERSRADRLGPGEAGLRQIGGLIRKATGALNDGNTGRAAGLRRAIDEKLQGVQVMPGYLTGQLQRLDKQLDEFKSWKEYAVAPKRLQLIEAMEALAGPTEDPQRRADEVKGLQEEWKTISKGAGSDAEAEWQRFREAAQAAYEPCREYFAVQAQIRAQNLQAREAVLVRLQNFEAGQNWEQADWRLVAQALRESKLELRRHSPIDRAAGRAVQDRFDEVTHRLQSRLDGEYARNIKQKNALVARARGLLGNEDSRAAIDEVKKLQLAWKTIGPAVREEDQRLWDEFRQHCDAIYQKRQQEYAEYAAGLAANKTQAEAVCAELEAIGGLSGPELSEGMKKVAALRAAFEALESFPREDTRALNRRFEQALERLDASVARQQAQDREQRWNAVFEAADLIRAHRLALATDAEPGELEAARLAAENYLAGAQHWPRGFLPVLKDALASPGGPDLAANETALKSLCIRAEILTDTPSPADEQDLRRGYQVQRLMQSMGQGSRGDQAELDALVKEWVGVGATRPEVFAAFSARFRRCRTLSDPL